MFNEITNKERASQANLKQLQELLDKRDTPTASAAFEVFKENDLDGAWWMHTTPEKLAEAGVKFNSGLSFLSWFGWLADRGKAHLPDADIQPHTFMIRIGPNPNTFEDLVVVKPEWLTEADGALDELLDHIAKNKREKPEVRQARSKIQKALAMVEAWHEQRPIHRITEVQIQLMMTMIEQQVRYANHDLNTVTRRFEGELEDVKRDLQKGYTPEQRSLSNYPDWQRAKERLSAWSEVERFFGDIIARGL